jgi:hypothetical protein
VFLMVSSARHLRDTASVQKIGRCFKFVNVPPKSPPAAKKQGRARNRKRTVTESDIHFWKIFLTSTPGIVDQANVAKTSIHRR